MDAEVKKKVKQKDNQFRTLVRKTHRHISRTIKTKQGIADFGVAISYLPASLHNHHILLSPDDRNHHILLSPDDRTAWSRVRNARAEGECITYPQLLYIASKCATLKQMFYC